MDVTLTAESGRALGSRASRRLRAEGKVPGVVYGLGQDTVSVAVEWPELRAALTTDAGLNALITLTVDGHEDLTIVKDLTRDPVRRDVVHVDFLRVSRDVEIQVDVPVVLEGHAEKVEQNDGTVAHLLFSLPIHAKPGAIPNELTIDVSDMEIGDTIRVGDLPLPEGVRTEVDPEEAVAIAQVSRATIEAAVEELEAAAEAEAEAEGEGGEAAEGEAGGEGEAAADEGGGDSGDEG